MTKGDLCGPCFGRLAAERSPSRVVEVVHPAVGRTNRVTPLDRTTTTTQEPSPVWLTWATVVTGLVSIVAVVILSLTHNTDAATAVGSIGTAATTVGGLQIGMRNRR